MSQATPPPDRPVPVWKLWANPIFRRYCRSRLRPQGLLISLLVVVLLAGFMVTVAWAVGTRRSGTEVDAARSAVFPLLGLQGFILFILGTAQAAGGMTAERDEGVIDYQRLLPLPPLAKVLGFLAGLPVREYVMFAATLPFTAWALWRGEVPWTAWAPLYLAVLVSTQLYHFTGLLAGTVVRNRRWAFLVSIGLVFGLYTVIPRLADFGLVFFRYLTITPVLDSVGHDLLPTVGRMARSLKESGNHGPAQFFVFEIPALAFTLLTQGGLILAFAAMLCRKWREEEAHLLSKVSAALSFLWVQFLLLGNALPMIEQGTIFPSFAWTGQIRPTLLEARIMAGLYGLTTLLLLFLLALIITPSSDKQIRGWRRAHKLGRTSLPRNSDAATSFAVIGALALVGAGCWFWFARCLVQSSWFGQQAVGGGVFLWFLALLVGLSLGFQALLENKGGKAVFLAVIFVGVVPLMAGTVFAILNFPDLASWVAGFSPLAQPFYATLGLIPDPATPEFLNQLPASSRVGTVLAVVAAALLARRLWQARRRLAAGQEAE